MFDAITQKPKRRSSKMGLIVSASVAAHAALAIGLIIAGMWQVERLLPPHRQLTISTDVKFQQTRTETPSVKVDIPPPKAAKAPKIKRLTQPTNEPVDTRPDPDAVYGHVPDEGPTGTTGTGFVGPSTGTLFPGDGPAFPVAEIPPPPTITKVIETKPPVILARVLEGERISGNAQIRPPESVRVAMFRDGERSVQGMVKMCLSERGTVSSLRMLKRTTYQAYDQKILSQMKQWRYQPYRVNGQATAVCTTVTFIYKMTN